MAQFPLGAFIPFLEGWNFKKPEIWPFPDTLLPMFPG
jgi:hypothetical protein